MQGTKGMPSRGWRGVFEMPGEEFIQAWPGRNGTKQLLSDWMSEAAKRFGIPILALAHALLAIGLVLTLSSATGRNTTTIAALVAIPAIHIGILIGTESIVRRDPFLVYTVALAIGLELAVALVLILRQQARFPVKHGARPETEVPRGASGAGAVL